MISLNKPSNENPDAVTAWFKSLGFKPGTTIWEGIELTTWGWDSPVDLSCCGFYLTPKGRIEGRIVIGNHEDMIDVDFVSPAAIPVLLNLMPGWAEYLASLSTTDP